MKICFHSPPGELSDSLRRAAQSALAAPVIDMAQIPPSSWKETLKGADLALIDATAANPTACYLTGLADAQNIRAILLSPIDDPLPAALDRHRRIIHRWNFDLLKAELSKLAAPASETDSPNDDTPAGKFHQIFGDLLKTHGYAHKGSVQFDGSTFVVREQDMDLPLVQEISHRAKSLNLRVRLL